MTNEKSNSPESDNDTLSEEELEQISGGHGHNPSRSRDTGNAPRADEPKHEHGA